VLRQGEDGRVLAPKAGDIVEWSRWCRIGCGRPTSPAPVAPDHRGDSAARLLGCSAARLLRASARAACGRLRDRLQGRHRADPWAAPRPGLRAVDHASAVSRRRRAAGRGVARPRRRRRGSRFRLRTRAQRPARELGTTAFPGRDHAGPRPGRGLRGRGTRALSRSDGYGSQRQEGPVPTDLVRMEADRSGVGGKRVGRPEEPGHGGRPW
jgi:hypothetical protein